LVLVFGKDGALGTWQTWKSTFSGDVAFATCEPCGALEDGERGDQGGIAEVFGVHGAETGDGEVIGAGEEDI
jgi:hypothetical protein